MRVKVVSSNYHPVELKEQTQWLSGLTLLPAAKVHSPVAAIHRHRVNFPTPRERLQPQRVKRPMLREAVQQQVVQQAMLREV